MKIKKRLLSLALSGVMVLGLMPGMNMTALAADNVSTYTLQIPSTLNVSAAGWNETSGLTAAVSSGDTFDSGKKLSVTASSANNWSLKSGDNSVGYNLTTATGSYSNSATPASWEFTAAELNANGGTNKAMGIVVEDYSKKPAGTYQDTVTFTAKVVTIRTVTWNNDDITGSGNSFTKDGVTITAGSIDFDEKNFEEDGTFTTALGKFTKIEVVATNGFCDVSGTGWSGDSDKRTWTGNASSVKFIGDIYGDGNGIKFVFTIER